MRKTLLSLLGFFLLAGMASAQEQPRTFKVPFHTLNGMILLDTGADNSSVSPSVAGVTTKLDALKPERRAGASGDYSKARRQ